MTTDDLLNDSKPLDHHLSLTTLYQHITLPLDYMHLQWVGSRI